jgi:hypothetical protein
MFAEFRSSASDVHDLRTVLADPCADLVCDFLRHHLGARGTGVDMAMGAGLVALATDVDLEGLESAPDERGTVFLEEGLEMVHGLIGSCRDGSWDWREERI